MKKILILLVLQFGMFATYAEERFAEVKIETIKVSEHIYMLTGAGGNIGVSNGDDGLLMIDDQFAPLADRIKTALRGISAVAPTFLLNTHYHGDHIGGNHLFANDSIIMAHHNVRIRLLAEDVASATLPVITYEKAAHIYFNDEEIQLTHLPMGHTDGDTLVHFLASNVIHLGDLFFNGGFPYIDLGAGGSVTGLILNIESTLEKIDSETKIIPGHGALGNKKDLVSYLDMLQVTSAQVKSAIKAGKSQQTVISKGLGKKWQSWGEGYINEERWIQTLWAEFG